MKVFLAGTSSFYNLVCDKKIPYLLESFYYIKDWQLEYIKSCEDFLLDSGAFTFISSGAINDLDGYLNSYIKFINDNNIEKFFELDVDSVVGYSKVLKYREKLEYEVGRKCIPVWHINRGLDEYLNLCENYSYIGLGGIAIKEFSQKDWRLFPWFIREAHKRSCMVHGLGFSAVNELKKYPFDTIDSTSWTSGGRFGSLYRFRKGVLKTYSRADGMRGLTNELNENNLIEWIKFQNYAKENL